MRANSLLALLILSAFAARAFAGAEQTVNDLIPRLASPTVADRFAPQMELQALAAQAARPGAETERAALAAILAAKAADATVAQPARVWIVRQLEYIGGQEAVAALASLLSGADAELQECARRALERNPSPDAAKPLRDALAKAVPGTFKIGLIQSLGARGDAEAVPLITSALEDAQTAPAALMALGKIANPAAVTALWAAFEKPSPGAGDALIVAARRALAGGDQKGAAAIYSRLYAAAVGTPLRPAALAGLAQADPVAAKPLLGNALGSGDLRTEGAALGAVDAVYGTGRAAFLASVLPSLKGSAEVLVLNALTSQSDREAEPQVRAAAADPDQPVRLAALAALGRIGDLESVPFLLKIAVADDAAERKAAATALARLPGPGWAQP